MTNILFLFLAIVTGSALCSIAEASFLSLPLLRARILVEQKKANAKDLLFIKDHLTETITTIVFINTVINSVGPFYIGRLVTIELGDHWLGIIAGSLTFSIVVFSEIIPKTIGERYKVPLGLLLAKPARLIVFLLHPIVLLLSLCTKPFVKGKVMPKVTEDEIRMMLKLGRAEGTVELDEEVLCSRVFKLNDVRAAQIMKPIDDIYSLEANKTLGQLKEEITQCRYSRIAVYDTDPKDFVGIVQQRVLLAEMAKDNEEAYIREFMTEPISVNWFMKADALLELFQSKKQHLFIVQDAHKKDVGIVTMEDVLEELFGEIYDEKDMGDKSISDEMKKNNDLT